MVTLVPASEAVQLSPKFFVRHPTSLPEPKMWAAKAYGSRSIKRPNEHLEEHLMLAFVLDTEMTLFSQCTELYVRGDKDCQSLQFGSHLELASSKLVQAPSGCS